MLSNVTILVHITGFILLLQANVALGENSRYSLEYIYLIVYFFTSTVSELVQISTGAGAIYFLDLSYARMLGVGEYLLPFGLFAL